MGFFVDKKAKVKKHQIRVVSYPEEVSRCGNSSSDGRMKVRCEGSQVNEADVRAE